MRQFFLLLVLVCLPFGLSWGAVYSCQDESGQRYFADNLQGLPEACQGQAKEINPAKTVDSVTFVPETPSPPAASEQFVNSVKEVERGLQQQQQVQQDLRQRAEKLRERFIRATKEKRQAKRRWEYGSRETIKKADAEIARVREKKKLLLQELAESGLGKEDRDYIRSQLGEISSE